MRPIRKAACRAQEGAAFALAGQGGRLTSCPYLPFAPYLAAKRRKQCKRDATKQGRARRQSWKPHHGISGGTSVPLASACVFSPAAQAQPCAPSHDLTKDFQITALIMCGRVAYVQIISLAEYSSKGAADREAYCPDRVPFSSVCTHTPCALSSC